MRSQEPDTPRTVSTKAGVFVLGKNEQVVGGEITNIYTAPLGRYGLVIQKLPSEAKLWLYDAKRSTATLVYRATDTLLQVRWFRKTNRAVVYSAGKILGLVDAEEKRFRPLSSPFKVFLYDLERYPESDIFLLRIALPQATGITSLSSEGRFTPIVPIGGPPHLNTLNFEGTLSDSHELVFSSLPNVSEKPQKPLVETWYALRLGEREARLLPDGPKSLYDSDLDQDKIHIPPLVLREESAKLTSEHFPSTETTALWLKATEPGQDKAKAQALVTVAPYPYIEPGSENEDTTYTLLSDLSAVLYLHEGSLYATSLTMQR